MTLLRKLGKLLPLLLLSAFLLPASHLRAQEPVNPTGQTAPAASSKEANEQEIDETAEYKHSKVVQKMAHMAGVSTEEAAAFSEWFNFGILAVLVIWFLAKTLPKTFRARTSGIQKDLVDARTATEEASQRLSSVEERLAKLDGQIAEMRSQSEKDTAADELRIKASVEEETRKILASADQEIAAATQTAQRQLQRYAAELAIEQAARKLVISAETDRLLVQGFVERLASDGGKGGAN